MIISIFQSTPPARGATSQEPTSEHQPSISIHAPREGGDLRTKVRYRLYEGFQSTPPARGATAINIKDNTHSGISIHAPREGGDFAATDDLHGLIISIHAPREGGDSKSIRKPAPTLRFQSTPPARGATAINIKDNTHSGISIHAPREGATGGCKRRDNTETKISIHAPREGGDVNFGIEKKVYYYFNPRPPRGGRLPAAVPAQADVDFNPRPPRGGRLI